MTVHRVTKQRQGCVYMMVKRRSMVQQCVVATTCEGVVWVVSRETHAGTAEEMTNCMENSVPKMRMSFGRWLLCGQCELQFCG